MVHHEGGDWWAVGFAGKANGKKPLAVQLVVVGHAGE
jgi:hypothetical protein